MAGKPPYVSQNPKRVANLIQALEAGSGKSRKNGKGFSCRRNTFPVQGSRKISVDSWKFSDWDYKRDDLPTYARGLFTYRRSNGDAAIASRGYDKFFNIEEINDTKWRNIETQTKGPYELSVKENGCIIFMSGLEDGTLLVCSKHSTGARQDSVLSHAVAGEGWVERHLASVGKTRDELAQELFERNVTAVAELCDDAFEEHVLAYDKASAGLYLHGINLNVPDFTTYSSAQVHEFADQWGFKKALYVLKDDIASTKEFLDGCAETGSWNGRDTEGFVVRCKKQVPGSEIYEDWFFKYKFEEPYLMYRQWREATKAMIAGRKPRYRKHEEITEEYLRFARRKLAQTPGLAKAYQANHGIIRLRDEFLRERGVKGSDIIREEYANDKHNNRDLTRGLVLAPIATLGCGKTTLGLALCSLFGWGHIQNDNITSKKLKPRHFAEQVSQTLNEFPVVIADRNNHQKRERAQLIGDVAGSMIEVKFVALHYVHHPKSQKLDDIRSKLLARVLKRGNNHQTIQTKLKSNEEIAGIMEGFLQRFEPADPEQDPDNGFELIIDLDPVADTRQNLETTVNALRETFPKLIPEPPAPQDIDRAIEDAMTLYAPAVKQGLANRGKEVAQKPNIIYFSLNVQPQKILSILDQLFSGLEPSEAAFYRQLKSTRRIQTAFHVTMVHAAAKKEKNKLWNKYCIVYHSCQTKQSTTDPLMGKCPIMLERAVWNNRVMCIKVRVVDDYFEIANAVPHITVGTADAKIKPRESNDLLQQWQNDGAGQSGIHDREIPGDIELLGEARAVMS